MAENPRFFFSAMQGFYNITQSAQKHPKASHKITFEDLSHLPDKPYPATIQFDFILFYFISCIIKLAFSQASLAPTTLGF
jgi:hypothetical protein